MSNARDILDANGVSSPNDNHAYSANLGAHREGISSTDVVSYYNEWAKKGTYEQDLCPERYTGPSIAARTVDKYYRARDNPNLKILDVAAGTGFLGEELAKLGYTNVDALEPSADMLALAKTKGTYVRYYVEAMGDKEVNIPSDTYDVLGIAGGMGEGHIPCAGLREMVRLVKPGGLVILVMREEYLSYVKEYKDRLEPLMAEMELEGKWTREERTVSAGYSFGKNGLVFVYRVI